MSSSKLTTEFVQDDWKNRYESYSQEYDYKNYYNKTMYIREFLEIVQLNIMKLIQFLNDFDVTIRGKLGQLNEKLNKVERNLEYCESALGTSHEEVDD